MADHQTTSTFHFKWDSYEGFQTLPDLVRTRMQREPDLDYGIFFLYNRVRWELQDQTWSEKESRHYNVPSMSLLTTMLKMYPEYFINKVFNFRTKSGN